jgi:hypothetical protein
MKRMALVVGFLILAMAGNGSPSARAREDSENFGKEIWIDANAITFRTDGTVDETDSGWVRGMVGMDLEITRSVRGDQRNSVRGGPHLIPYDWGTSLFARTEFKPGEGILFHLEWREEGKLVRTEEVVSRDFTSVTRTLLVEPETGLKHVVRFSPSLDKGSGPPPAPQRADRMRFNPGMTSGPLLRDGKMVGLIPGFGPSYEKVYINLPGIGFFQFSLLPFPGFEPSGRLDGAVVRFDWRGQKYQWFLGRAPLPNGVWTMYVKATDEIPPEWRRTIQPEFANEISVGGSYGPS